jgi:hypothetical protein
LPIEGHPADETERETFFVGHLRLGGADALVGGIADCRFGLRLGVSFLDKGSRDKDRRGIGCFDKIASCEF